MNFANQAANRLWFTAFLLCILVEAQAFTNPGDLIIGSDTAPSIWDYEAGANTDPGAASAGSSPELTFNWTDGSDHESSLITGLDSAAITNDVDDGGNVDAFLSTSFDFNDIGAGPDSTESIIEETPPRMYVAAASTPDSSLNQDLNGVNGGGISSTNTLDQPGAMQVPEPAIIAVLGAGCIFILTSRWVRRSRSNQ